MYLCGVTHPNANLKKSSHYSRTGKHKGPVYYVQHTEPCLFMAYTRPQGKLIAFKANNYIFCDSSDHGKLQVYSDLGVSCLIVKNPQSLLLSEWSVLEVGIT